jgi:hypothetical protein
VGAPLDRSVPREVRPEHELSCPPPQDYRRDKEIVVRLWVMDRSGAVTVLEDTMPVVDGPVQAAR